MLLKGITLLAIGSISSSIAHAKKPAERSAVFQKLIDCRAIGTVAERLACYDAQIAILDAAERDRQIVVVDKKQMVEARRGLFGFTLPSLKIFGGDDDDEAAKLLETTVRAASRGSNGEWIIILADGARWRQIDDRPIMAPKAGQTIQIRRSGIGTYFARVGGQNNGMKVRREN
jgi:hypothetical protein